LYKKYIYIHVHILCKITSATITKYSSWTQMFMIYRQIEWNTKNTTLLDQNLKIIETCKIDTLRPVTFLVWYRYFNKTWRVKASFMGKHLLQMDSYCLTSHLFYSFQFCWRWNTTPTSKPLRNLYQTRFVSSTPHHDRKWNIILRLHRLKCNYHNIRLHSQRILELYIRLIDCFWKLLPWQHTSYVVTRFNRQYSKIQGGFRKETRCKLTKYNPFSTLAVHAHH